MDGAVLLRRNEEKEETKRWEPWYTEENSIRWGR